MRRFFIAPLFFTFLSPAQADETCLFISQYEPDLIIEVSTKNYSSTKGFIKYKGSPIFRFKTGIRNGYRGQYFYIAKFSNPLSDKDQKIVSGSVITIIGDQSGTGTPKGKRKQGMKKVFFPNFGLNYYYSLANTETRIDRTEGRNRKINSILNAAEGFWIPSEICKKYVPYGW